MPDISMCNGQDCPIKEYCYRYTAEPSEFWQTWGMFEFNKETGCNYFMANEKDIVGQEIIELINKNQK